MQQPYPTDTIIFDLGNVIVDIDYEVMLHEFAHISTVDFSEIVAYSRQDKVFDHYEKGLISTAEFRQALRKYIRQDVSDAAIDAAWNSILIDYPADKFELLKLLRGKYKILALSNINELHAEAIDKQISHLFGEQGMSSFFDRLFYSHKLGLRKPEAGIYRLLLEAENLDPARTLFIDDKKENTDAAQQLGIKTYHLNDRSKLVPLFKEWGLV